MNAELQIVMPLDALLDANNQTPAELDGYGPLPADLARDLLATSTGRLWWRRLYAAPLGGPLVGGDPHRRRFDGHVKKLIMWRDRRLRAVTGLRIKANGSTNVAGVLGHCESGFERVAEVFAAQLASGRDVGGSVGVYLDGQPVVEIWGGSADPGRGVPWAEHTITPIGSTGKALASTAVLILVDRGLVDLDEPVARYWPAFGQNGKDDIPVHLVLSHRSGVAALDEPISNDQAAALDPVLRLIEQQRPWWQPGAKHGYHAMTYGFIMSGLVRAVTGRTVGEFFADEVARPLELDLHIGLPRELYDTVAPMIGPSQRQAIRSMINPVWFRYALGVASRRSVSYKATLAGTSVSFDDAEELVRYDVEDASAGALGNGPSLARMFAALIGEVDGRRLISADLMNAARQPQVSGRDIVLRVRTDWGLGFALPGGPMWPDVGVPGIFGHSGASGSLAFADPEHRLTFGYTPNLWAELSGWFNTPFRFHALTEAVYACAGVRRWPRAISPPGQGIHHR